MKHVNPLNQAIELIHNGEMNEAFKLLQQEAENSDTDGKLDIAEIYSELGMQEEAAHLLEEVIQIEPYNNEAKLMLAEIFINDNNDEKAIMLLNEIDEQSESFLQALVLLADLYQTQGLFEVAESKLLEAKRRAPDEPIIDLALAELLFSIGSYHKAIIYYEKISKTTEEMGGVNLQARLAESFALNGQFEEALRHFQALEIEDPDQLFRYGFLAFQAERFEIAIQAWERLLDLDSEYPSVYPYLSEAFEEEGLLEEAYNIVSKGLEIDPYNKEIWFIAGKIANKLGNREESYQYMEEALKIDPEYQEALLFLLEAFKKEENYQKLINVLTTIVDIDHLDGVFQWELAKAYNEEEQYKEALFTYQKAYTKMNSDTDFLRDYGYFLVEEGRISEAISIFKQYMKWEPADFEIQQYIERLMNQNDTLS